jgi:hypothetical protein
LDASADRELNEYAVLQAALVLVPIGDGIPRPHPHTLGCEVRIAQMVIDAYLDSVEAIEATPNNDRAAVLGNPEGAR